MKNIFVDRCNPVYTDIDGVLCSKDKKTLVQYPGDHSSVYTVPEGITTIAPYAFQYLSSWFWKINFSSTVTTIGEYAFIDNVIKEIVIPANVVNFGREAFFNTWLQHVYYLGLHDPDPGNTKTIFFCNDNFAFLYLPIDYQDNSFCDRVVNVKNHTFDEYRGRDNACYQAVVYHYYQTYRDCFKERPLKSSKAYMIKRPAIFDWTSQSTYSCKYQCDNETGANLTDNCRDGKVCVEGKCVVPTSSSSDSSSSFECPQQINVLISRDDDSSQNAMCVPPVIIDSDSEDTSSQIHHLSSGIRSAASYLMVSLIMAFAFLI